MTDIEDHPELHVPTPFRQFYLEEYPKLVALMYAATGSRWAAEDLAQEALFRSHLSWQAVGCMDSPQAWVRRVAMNLARSRFRRLRAEAVALSRWRGPPSPPQPDEDTQAFWGEVRRLTRRQQQVVALRYVDDLSIAEISECLEIAEGTVKALLHQARGRLTVRLGESSSKRGPR